MSTSDKLTYLNETKQRQKTLINALGGNITNDTPFREYEKELVGVLPKVTGEGTNISLSPTIEYDLEVTSLQGDTTQTTYTGINLANTNETIEPTTINGITYSLENGVFSFSGTASSATTITLTDSFPLSAGTYTIGVKDQTGSYTGTLGKYVVTKPYTVRIDGNVLSQVQTRTTTENYDNCYISFYIGGNVTFTNLKFKLILVSGTYTSSTLPNYEPYCGGIPSPNPNYPQDIQVVTGTQEVKICGKNMFNPNNITFTSGILNNEGEQTASTASHYTNNFWRVKPSTTYALSGTLRTENIGYRLYYYDNDKNWLDRTANLNTTSYTFTTTSNCYYIRLQVANEVTLNDIQLEYGSSATTYEPYKSQTYTLHLGDLELAKIGNYQDKIYYDNGKWYLEKQLKKSNTSELATSGYETGGNFSNFSTNGNIALDWTFPDLKITSARDDIICNKLVSVSTSLWYGVGQGISTFQNANKIIFGVNFNDVQTFAGTTLATNNYQNFTVQYLKSLNAIFYYILNEATTTEITNTTLLQDLNYIKEHAMSYSGTTNISSSGDLSIVISASAIKQLS